jgi:spermidine/putrescine transport system permease protein
MTSNARWLLIGLYGLFLVYLFIPLLILIAMSFKDSAFVGFPIESWTTRWYAQVVGDPEIVGSIAFSLTIAIASTLFALVIGVWVALFLGPTKFWWKIAVFALMCLPMVTPGIISAISLRIFIRSIQLEPGMAAIIFGHTVHNVPFVALMAMARLSSLPRSQIEAARDLGADSLIAFLRVTLPYLRPALIGAAIFCLLLSFDDFVRSYFLGSYQPTIPVLIFAKLRSGMSPEINAISTVVLVASVILGLWAERSIRRLRRG